MSNLQFLMFFINIIKVVNDYEILLRVFIVIVSNDYRLGVNEVLLVIILVFIGEQLMKVLMELESVIIGKLFFEEKIDLKLNVVGKILDVFLDNIDRNRIFFFVFIGNKFEFRVVGLNLNCLNVMIILNVIVVKQLKDFKIEVDILIDIKGLKKDEVIFNVLREYIKEFKKIFFEGDGYSDVWEKEVVKRGLSNFKIIFEVIKVKVFKQVLDLFVELGILNYVEVEVCYEIELEEYIKKIQIEGRVLGDIVRNYVILIVICY